MTVNLPRMQAIKTYLEGFKHKTEYMPLVLAVVYFIFLIATDHMRTSHYQAIGGALFVWYFHAKTRRIGLALLPILTYVILYDGLTEIPNFMFNEVHIKDLYDLEKSLFGIEIDGKVVTLNEYFRANRTFALDLTTGLFYANWMNVPLGVAVYLFFKSKREAVHFGWVFLFANILGITTYYLYPAAAPWYISDGPCPAGPPCFEFFANTQGSAAGLADFDKILENAVGIKDYYASLYRSGHPFAAVPSMHSAFPILVLLYALRSPLKLWNIVLATHMVGIWFSAIYLNHHYVLDVFLGIVYALVAYTLFEFVIYQYWAKEKLDAAVDFITPPK